MKTKLILIVFLFLTSIVSAQIPDGYYDDADGLTGGDLKTALYNIIKGHVEFSYTSSSTDVWDILKETDKDPDNEDNVILFYTGWSVDAEQEYNGGSGWTREHVWSKSHGDFGTTQGAGTDAHHLRPADLSVNSAKNNRWFDNCSTPYYDDGIFTGCYKDDANWAWEPRDEVKGDVARMMFYMATRYEGSNGEPDLELINYFPSNNNTSEPIYAMLNTLLQWNIEDPVDDWERNRNDIIYYDYQHNRNPFIDYPEFVEDIWGVPTYIDEKLLQQVEIYPNPATSQFTINTQSSVFTTIIIYNLQSAQVFKTISYTERTTIFTSFLEPGLYFVKIIQNNQNTTQKLIIVD